MGHIKGIKWEKVLQCRPVDNLISTDFPKFVPPAWKFMEGHPKMSLVLANEYQRLWVEERDALHKKMYPENTTVNVDVVKRYIKNFKKIKKPPKPEPKKPFMMKKFQNIKNVTNNKRPPDDKAMQYLKNKNEDKSQKKPIPEQPKQKEEE